MEDVLAVYQLPHDPRFPVGCMDESNKQLVGEVHAPIPVAPGHGHIVDHEYVRNGVATLFVEVELQLDRRHVEVTERRARQIGRGSSRPCSTSATRRRSRCDW